MRRFLILLASLVTAIVVVTPVAGAGVGDGPPADYFVDESKLPFDPLPGFEDADRYWGILKGAGYRVEVPADWNGDLVMWAHGFRGTGLELTVDNHPLREFLVANGFAWAASSYSRNDYDVSVGVQDTHALAQFFNGLVADPDKVYITGVSMGGHITAASIEQYTKAYDGALPACGVLGDYELFDYFLDFNLAAQQLGTGTSTYPLDPAQYVGVTVPTIKSNLEAVPGTWPFTLNAAGTNHKNLTELRSGGERPNYDEAFAFWNSIPAASGAGNFLFELGLGDGTLPRAPGSAVENVGVVYQFDTDPALTSEEQAFNDGVFRTEADPQTRRPNGLAQVPTLSGDIEVPVLTLHNLGDLFVPVHNEIVYAERVTAQGNSDLLVQRAIRGVGHCGFTPTEFATAFVDLVGWVESGAKPAGDNWLDPAEVASDDFGCTFTDFDTPNGHILATPCP